MSLRVDLMLQEELRYQGAVSKRFIAVSGGAIVVCVLLLWVATSWMQRSSLNDEVAQLEAEWGTLEPRFNVAKAKLADHTLIQSIENELKPWNTTRVEWAPLLDELNSMVPETIQLTRLSFRSEWSIIKQPAPPQDDPDKQPAPTPPGVPGRRVYMNLAGRAAGDAGSDDAVRMVQAIKNSAGYSAVFETIKLQSLLRDTQQGDAADRTFSIEEIGLLRKLQ